MSKQALNLDSKQVINLDAKKGGRDEAQRSIEDAEVETGNWSHSKQSVEDGAQNLSVEDEAHDVVEDAGHASVHPTP